MSLFDSAPGRGTGGPVGADPDAELDRDRLRLVAAYAEILLDEQPVRSVADGVPGRERAAERFAAKDVSRMFAAAAAIGVRIVLEEDPEQWQP